MLSKLFSLISESFGRGHKGQPPRETASPGARTIYENRPLNPDERALIAWLIANGNPDAKNYASQLEGLHVVSRCGCGCPTIDLAARDGAVATTGPSHILADFLGATPEGIRVGVILHAREGKLSELEVYPLLGEPVQSLPKVETLNAFERPKDWT